ncbi:Uncharacterised protein [Mobiluncus mulieris]|uniref:Uncharacterized protein n=1 Tax=Mobiluncus mulieris TaxID=2052 RepID=A0A8G2M7R7_9ACTO|nr:Uncharacterised protein [Mobiluncus mulieris]
MKRFPRASGGNSRYDDMKLTLNQFSPRQRG